jgi:hypothetical protein
MKSGKEGFLERYGGFRLTETDEQLKARMRRMDELYAKEQKTLEDIAELDRLKGSSD